MIQALIKFLWLLLFLSCEMFNSTNSLNDFLLTTCHEDIKNISQKRELILQQQMILKKKLQFTQDDFNTDGYQSETEHGVEISAYSILINNNQNLFFLKNKKKNKIIQKEMMKWQMIINNNLAQRRKFYIEEIEKNNKLLEQYDEELVKLQEEKEIYEEDDRRELLFDEGGSSTQSKNKTSEVENKETENNQIKINIIEQNNGDKKKCSKCLFQCECNQDIEQINLREDDNIQSVSNHQENNIKNENDIIEGENQQSKQRNKKLKNSLFQNNFLLPTVNEQNVLKKILLQQKAIDEIYKIENGEYVYSEYFRDTMMVEFKEFFPEYKHQKIKQGNGFLIKAINMLYPENQEDKNISSMQRRIIFFEYMLEHQPKNTLLRLVRESFGDIYYSFSESGGLFLAKGNTNEFAKKFIRAILQSYWLPFDNKNDCIKVEHMNYEDLCSLKKNIIQNDQGEIDKGEIDNSTKKSLDSFNKFFYYNFRFLNKDKKNQKQTIQNISDSLEE
jgi:hypothetical protein